MFSLNRIGEIVAYALAVGVCIRIFATAYQYFWNIETGRAEAAVLAGTVMGFLVVWGIDSSPRTASLSTGLIIAGYFVAQVIKRRWL